MTFNLVNWFEFNSFVTFCDDFMPFVVRSSLLRLRLAGVCHHCVLHMDLLRQAEHRQTLPASSGSHRGIREE